MSQDPVVAVPADIELDEHLFGPVTFRMAGWLSLAACGGLLITARPASAAPDVGGALLLFLGGIGAFWRPGGRPVLAWFDPLWRYRRRTAPALSWRPAVVLALLVVLATGALLVGRWTAFRATPNLPVLPSAQPTLVRTGGSGCGC